MSDTNGAAIDPRYDPAFQRGFSGEVQTGAHGQSTLRRTAAVNPGPSRAPSQAAHPTSPPPGQTSGDDSLIGPPPPEWTRTTGDPAVATIPEPVVQHDLPEPASVVTPRELARNPFVIALAALAAVLIIAGAVWAYEGFAAIVKNGGTRNEVEFWAAQTMSFGAPLAIIVGLGVLAVVLGMFGRAWHRS